ncbi:MAG: molybdopterin-dependent oxidoreductase, partial [Raoultibacter sp.]
MKTNYRNVIGLLASGALVATAAPAVQALALDTSTAPENGSTKASATSAQASNETEMTLSSRVVTVPNISGSFSCNQAVATSNTALAKTLYKASDYLCGQGVLERTTVAGDHSTIEVRGDVGHAFTANIEEQVKKDPLTKIMGCTCAGNPEDGSASANAQVTGFRLSGLIHEAEPEADANTITFISHDGYKVSLPLSYVTQRYSIIVTE